MQKAASIASVTRWEHTDQLLAFHVDLAVNSELLLAWSALLHAPFHTESTESRELSLGFALPFFSFLARGVGRRMTGIRVREPGREQAYSRSAAGAYASENEMVRDVTRHFYPEQLLPSTSTCLLHGFASASLSEPSYRYASCRAPVFTRQTSQDGKSQRWKRQNRRGHAACFSACSWVILVLSLST